MCLMRISCRVWSITHSRVIVGVLVLLAILSVSDVYANPIFDKCHQTMAGCEQTFKYFAYGSNLLSKRLHIQNPTAVRFAIGKLNGYRLDFMTQSNRWHGASATIVAEDGASVYGAIWELDMCNMATLDNQEGVHQKIYKPIEVLIESEHGELIDCRTYQQVSDPTDDIQQICDLPPERQPSLTYLQTIQHGAEESGLPAEYLAFLRSIPNNGNVASPKIMADLSM